MHDEPPITVLTERGQVSIPASLRRRLKLVKGQRLLWECLSDQEIKITVVGNSPSTGASSVLGFARRFREPKTTEDWMVELRAGEK